jgi:hypothetical protein
MRSTMATNQRGLQNELSLNHQCTTNNVTLLLATGSSAKDCSGFSMRMTRSSPELLALVVAHEQHEDDELISCATTTTTFISPRKTRSKSRSQITVAVMPSVVAKRKVQFDRVHIHEFPRALGDSGASKYNDDLNVDRTKYALCLDSKSIRTTIMDVDTYEATCRTKQTLVEYDEHGRVDEATRCCLLLECYGTKQLAQRMADQEWGMIKTTRRNRDNVESQKQQRVRCITRQLETFVAGNFQGMPP